MFNESTIYISLFFMLCLLLLFVIIIWAKKRKHIFFSILAQIAGGFLFIVLGGVYFTSAGGGPIPLGKIIAFCISGIIILNLLFNLEKIKNKPNLYIGASLILSVLLVIMGILFDRKSCESYKIRMSDPRKVSDIRQIELGLELHYMSYHEHPTNIQVLVNEGWLNMSSLPTDPRTKEPYNYAYGINKETDKIEYYHLGAILNNKDSDMLKDDIDYNSSFNTELVDWQFDENYVGPCIGKNGFDGSDNSVCGAIYDRGILPK
jgi:hypothetical protein